MLVEAAVLDRDLRVLHVLGDLLQRDDDAVLVVRGGDQPAVGVEILRLLGQRRDGELARQGVEQLDAGLGGAARGAHRRDHQTSGEQAHHHRRGDEGAQQAEHVGEVCGASLHGAQGNRRRPPGPCRGPSGGRGVARSGLLTCADMGLAALAPVSSRMARTASDGR